MRLLTLSIVKQDSLTFSSNVNAVVQTRFHHHEKLKKIVLTWLLHSRSVGFFFQKAIVSLLWGLCFIFYVQCNIYSWEIAPPVVDSSFVLGIIMGLLLTMCKAGAWEAYMEVAVLEAGRGCTIDYRASRSGAMSWCGLIWYVLISYSLTYTCFQLIHFSFNLKQVRSLNLPLRSTCSTLIEKSGDSLFLQEKKESNKIL